MLRRCLNRDHTAQVFLEYVIIISVVILAITAMSALIKRGTQGMIKVVADEIGSQPGSEQNAEEGYLKLSSGVTRSASDKLTTEFLGQTSYDYDDEVVTSQTALINLGFSEGN